MLHLKVLATTLKTFSSRGDIIGIMKVPSQNHRQTHILPLMITFLKSILFFRRARISPQATGNMERIEGSEKTAKL